MVYAEGEDERVLRAVQIVVDEKLATPILIGRPGGDRARAQASWSAASHRRALSPSSTPNTMSDFENTGRLSQAHRAQRRYRAIRAAGNAAPYDADRRHAAEEGRGGWNDLRNHQHHRAAFALHRSGDRASGRGRVFTVQ